MLRKTLPVLTLALALAMSAAAPAPPPFTYTPAVEAALDRISADSLKGNLSFIASDLLGGRDTPSRGLDTAAEYIAAQFRKAGLEPAGDDGYFQTAPFVLSDPKPETFELKLETAKGTLAARDVTVHFARGLKIERAQAAVAEMAESAPLPEAASVAGKVLFAAAAPGTGSSFRRIQALRALKPALLVTVQGAGGPPPAWFAPRRLVEADVEPSAAPWVTVKDEALAKAVREGLAGATASVSLEVTETPVKLRNVVGLLRGSDPALRDTYVLVTAHYDHLGIRPDCKADDCIFNGANDDGSGTVSVIETANALASLDPRPRRSIVFMTFFGEERGLFGSRYYTRHPIFPLEKTVADVNLEQLGRTDAGDGPQVGTATFTGYGYSDVTKTFEAAGALTGIKVYKSAPTDRYFGASDNVSFAQAGIPAHTMSVAYAFPDYHKVSDSWERIDYANMARVDRMVALGVLMLAESAEAPRWNEGEAKTAPYVKAWKEKRAK